MMVKEIVDLIIKNVNNNEMDIEHVKELVTLSFMDTTELPISKKINVVSDRICECLKLEYYMRNDDIMRIKPQREDIIKKHYIMLTTRGKKK